MEHLVYCPLSPFLSLFLVTLLFLLFPKRNSSSTQATHHHCSVLSFCFLLSLSISLSDCNSVSKAVDQVQNEAEGMDDERSNLFHTARGASREGERENVKRRPDRFSSNFTQFSLSLSSSFFFFLFHSSIRKFLLLTPHDSIE